jgi:prepilin-type N-terminal cleavage/methylation domain-containing protein/prepilin-type processing-associated H-X9-DG protein
MNLRPRLCLCQVRRPDHRAFTLVELLVTIGIIGILAALALGTASTFIRRGDSSKCLSQLRNLATAALAAKTDHNGKFPAFRVHHWDANGFLSSNATFEWSNLPVPPSIGEVLGTSLGFEPMNTLWIAPSLMPQPLQCPAARKNSRQAWINQCAAYRYNAYAIGRTSASPRAMLFQDTCWPDWNAKDFSHQGPPGLNIAYADGHIAFMDLAAYLKVNPDSNKEYQNQFFMQGWLD